MLPLLLFVLSDRQPSVNPEVFKQLYHVVGSEGQNFNVKNSR